MPIQLNNPNFNEALGSHSDKGADFQQFVGELFADEFPGLIAYKTAGRDGGIDLFHPASGTVFECKFIGTDGADEVEKRWKEIAKRLQDNLQPKQPKQSQYAPWYSPNPVIVSYRFCTSNRLENESRRQLLQSQIQQFFQQLAKTDASLRHLAQIQVDIWSWDRLEPHLAKSPALRLKWFDQSSFRGLEWLKADAPLQNNFRDYLDERRLPFHALPELEISPLYQRLRQQQVGLIAHGQGGVGKTRLLRELGFYALHQGHAVYLVKPATIKPETLVELVRTAVGAPVLLLMDYIERIPAFEELVGIIEEYNEDGADIRLFATCRNSHFQTHRSAHSLSELALDAYDSKAVARHILSPLPRKDDLLELCCGIPILAVFLRYLYDKNQTTELNSLLEDGDFSRWWDKRLPASDDSSLRLLAIYPCDDAALDVLKARCLATDSLHQQLCRDGWVYQDASDNSWQLAHDVLADQTLFSHLQESSTRHRLLRLLLQDATACQTQESSLLALRRIAERLPDTHWFSLFQEHADSWRPWLALLLTGNLFAVAERLAFLDLFAAEATALTAEPAIQGILGWIVRQCWKYEEPKIAASRLRYWLDAATTQELSSNFVLTQSLHWDSRRYAANAQIWLQQHPPSVNSHFLLCAWLDTRLPVFDIENRVSNWLQCFSRTHWASFVFSSWLDSTQNGAFVQEAIGDWLAEKENCLSNDAGFVYRGWLDATQDGAFVREAIRDWLAEEHNLLSPEAGYVYRGWLDATQDGAFVQEAIREWLAVEQNRQSPDAGFVYRAWLDATEDGAFVQEAIREWLAVEQNRQSPDAGFVYRAWLDATEDGAFVQDAIRDWLSENENCRSPDAGFVFKGWLDAKGEHSFIAAAVYEWLAHGDNATALGTDFIYRAWGDAEKRLPQEMLPYAFAWLHHYATEADAVYCLKYIVKAQVLDADTVRAALTWCRTYPKHEDALSRLSDLKENLRLLPIAEALPTWQAVLAWRVSMQFGIYGIENLFLRSIFHILHSMALRDADQAAMEKLVDCFAYCLINTASFTVEADAKKGDVHDAVFPDLAVRLLRRKISTPDLFRGLKDLLIWFDTWSEEEKTNYCRELLTELHRQIVPRQTYTA